MMKKINFSIVLLCLAIISALLCGCSAEKKEVAVEQVPAAAAVSTPKPTPEPSEYPLLGKMLSKNTTELDLSSLTDAKAKQAAEELALFPSIERITLGDENTTPLKWSSIEMLCKACPDAELDYSFTLYDLPFNLSDEEMDLKYIPIDDEGELVKQITACMTRLKLLDMDSCGISDEKMAELRDSLPSTEVIWRIKFGDYYSVRTNVEKILASMPGQGGELAHYNVEPLKYCTKVKYLDLGHNNHLDNIDFTAYMPDLEVLIVGMTFVEDFSPLVNCPKLEYLEAMSSRIHDLTPFAELKNLKHLNICFDFAVRDITPLYGLDKLERLWLGMYDPIPPEQLETIKKLLPNCIVNDTVDDPTNDGWRMELTPDEFGNPRYAQRYELLRQQFGYEEMDYAFYWTDPLYRYGLSYPVFGQDVEVPFTDF